MKTEKWILAGLLALTTAGVCITVTRKVWPDRCTDYLFVPEHGKEYFRKNLCHYPNQQPAGINGFVLCKCEEE